MPSIRPQVSGINNRPASGLSRPGGFGNSNLSGVVHNPGLSSRPGFGNRAPIEPGGGITRSDFGNRGNLGGATQRPGGAGNRPGSLPGFKPDGGLNGGRSTANLPGLGGGTRPGAGGAGTRQAGINNRPGAGGAGTQNAFGNRGTPQERANDLSSRFNEHYGDSGWHHQQWNGPNGGEINHVGFWGPNGYWGHTGAWGPNGGHWGRSTGIGPNGAYSRTIGWGPNGAVWGHGGAIGPNGAFHYAGYYGPAGHWSRNWGGWYNGYGPAWGYGRWDYLWNQYPVAMAFGATMWGITAVDAMFGVGSYYNPYCDAGSAYSQPVAGDPAYAQQQTADTSEPATTDPATTDPATTDPNAPAPDDALTAAFDQARDAFHNDQFDQALALTEQALEKAPRDAAINEFRSLCLFALGQYRESSATIHAAGPGWDWTTMISLYSGKEAYEGQLRKLEEAVKANPQAADQRFLLAYHYLTCNHKDAALTQWKHVVELQPDDELSADLVKMYSPPAESDTQVADTAPPAEKVDKPAYPMEKLEGSWNAQDDRGSFTLTLNDDDSFTWKFNQNGKDQTVKGAYTVRGKNLVMQPESGGVMLSDITLNDDNTLVFTALGDKKKLTFTKS